MNLLIPARLKKGDLLGIICPASPVRDPSRIEKSVRYFESLGYRAKVGRNAARQVGYLAGTDEERAEDIHEMFADKNVRGIFCARGGYGTPRLLGRLNYRLIARNPKVFVGYSDITALALAIWKKCRLVTYHGPMAAVDLAGDVHPAAEESLWRMITSPEPHMALRGAHQIPDAATFPGSATGRLLGGNLSLLVSLLGTPFMPDAARGILFLEEIGEEPYRVDRMLTQLANARILSRAGGILTGQFTDCVPKDPAAPSLTIGAILSGAAHDAGRPFLTGFPFGHERGMLTLPIGIRATLDAGRGSLTLREPPVSP